MTTIDSLKHHMTHAESGDGYWRYEFPNGRVVSVISDLYTFFRFEIRVDQKQPVSGLTTEQVEAKLAAVYALPAEPATIAEGQ